MFKKLIHHKIFAFLFCYAMYASIAAYRTEWSFSKKKLEKSGQINKEDLGNCDTIFLLFYGLGNLIFGKKGDEIDLRKFLGVGLFFIILSHLGFILLGFTDSQLSVLFYLTFVLNGLAQSTMWPGIIAILSNWFGNESKGLFMNLFISCYHVGNIVIYQLASVVFDKLHYNWFHLLFVSCIPFTVLLLTIFLLKPYPEELENNKEFLLNKQEQNITNEQLQQGINTEEGTPQQTRGIGLIKALKINGVVQYTLVYGCIKAGYYALIFWLPYYFETKLGFQDRGAGVLQVADISVFVFSLCIGHVSDKIKARAYILFPMLFVSTIVLVLIPYIPVDQRFIYYIAVPLGLTLIVTPYNQIGSAIASDIAKNKELVGQKQAASTVAGLIQGVGGILAALSQQVTARLTNYFFIFVAILVGVSTILFIPLAWRDYKDRVSRKQGVTRENENGDL